MTGEQELGYVEKTPKGWEWHGRMIPGPYGSFAGGVTPTEFAARHALEKHWDQYLILEGP